MSTTELPALDRGQLLRDVELRALRDSQADWTDIAPSDLPPGPVHREIEWWAEQRMARITAARLEAETEARGRIREADSASVAIDERRSRADDDAAAAERRRADAASVLRGEHPGDDGGDWSDRSRMDESPRRRKVVDLLVYGSAAAVDGGINYLALRLMNATPLETALLAAAVVMVSVLLPKQLGVLVTTARRTGRWTGWPAASMLGAATLWIGTVVFVALIRTAYLLLPVQMGNTIGRPPLLAVAGVGPTVLTLGWLAVALAIGAAVLLRSARSQPVRGAWHRAVVETERLGEARSVLRAAAERSAEQAASERDSLRATRARFDPPMDECRALAAELKDRYVHALALRRTSVEQRGLPDEGRPAIAPPVDGTAA